MEAIDQKSGIPSWWSLKPEDTLGMVFWTKDPSNLIANRSMFHGYNVKVHVTATGWHEVEKGAPNIEESGKLLYDTVEAFGEGNVIWRFSPVPLLPTGDLLARFYQLAESAKLAGIHKVYVSFLQPNDLLPETRSWGARLHTLSQMAITVGAKFGLDILLCNEDRTLERWNELLNLEGDPVEGPPPSNLRWGICADPVDYGSTPTRAEGCGCVLMVDPFTINESCTMGCLYCYAADKSLADKKRNTTRLPVVR